MLCIKQVANPKYFSELTLDPETGSINREKVPSILNPMDENAVEEALRLRDKFGGNVTVISMGPPQAKEVIDWALILGADQGILLCDKAFAAADSLATAYVLASAIKKIGPVDIVFCGNESADGATQQVGPQIAELLDIPHISNAVEVSVEEGGKMVVKRFLEYGHMKIKATYPVVITVSREINEPRTATAEGILGLDEKVFQTWGVESMDVDPQKIGLEGSPTRVHEIREEKIVRQREILQGTPEELVDNLIASLDRESLL